MQMLKDLQLLPAPSVIIAGTRFTAGGFRQGAGMPSSGSISVCRGCRHAEFRENFCRHWQVQMSDVFRGHGVGAPTSLLQGAYTSRLLCWRMASKALRRHPEWVLQLEFDGLFKAE